MNRRIASNPSLNLGTCLPTVLFGHLALQLFGHFRNKLVSASLYLVTAIAIVAGALLSREQGLSHSASDRRSGHPRDDGLRRAKPTWSSLGTPSPRGQNAYDAIMQELGLRLERLYQSFAWLIGAQIVISGINTALTAVFLAIGDYPYTLLLISLVFLFGLLPIAGNLISNTVIVAVGFTLSPKTPSFFASPFTNSNTFSTAKSWGNELTALYGLR